MHQPVAKPRADGRLCPSQRWEKDDSVIDTALLPKGMLINSTYAGVGLRTKQACEGRRTKERNGNKQRRPGVREGQSKHADCC